MLILDKSFYGIIQNIMGKKEKIPKGILQNIITYFCFKANPNSITKLMKLCYLAEVYYYQMHDKRLTDVPFKNYHYGPWAKEIWLEVEALYEKGIIKEKVIKTRTGKMATIPKPNIPKTKVSLSKDVFTILEDVIVDWGNAKTDEIVQYCKKTPPFVNTLFDKKIDFSRTDEIKEIAKKKGISEEKAATLDVITNKKLLKNTLKGIKDAQKGRLLDHKSVFG